MHSSIYLEHVCNILIYTACIQFLKIGNVHNSILRIPFFFKIVKFYLEVCLLKFYIEEPLYHIVFFFKVCSRRNYEYSET